MYNFTQKDIIENSWDNHLIEYLFNLSFLLM